MKKINKTILITSLITSLFITIAFGKNIEKNIDGSVKYKRTKSHYKSYKINPKIDKQKYTYGRIPTKAEIKAWDIDVMPDGTGLPKGSGTAETGEELYDAQCALCHGDYGSGGKGYPALSGGEHDGLANQLLDASAGDEPPIRTIGTYWPYASTLFWYIKTGMPFNKPMSLSADETYAIVAFLLNVNEVTFKDGSDIEELNQKNFKDILMPNHDGFYPDMDSKNAKKLMKKFLSNPNNYGKGKRCMKNCIKGKVPVMRIKNELKGFIPPISVERNWKESETKTISKAQKIYENTCSACHSSDALGAPVVGDKESWDKVVSQGIDKVYKNAINGINAMPPKGGDMELSNKEVEEVVDYMINQTKRSKK